MWDNWPSAGIQWKGVGILKRPDDLILQQQIIWNTKPDILVEMGTWRGGSALFYADVGVEVVTVEIRRRVKPWPQHDNILHLHGDSTDPAIRDRVYQACEGKKVMVVLDSDHHKQTVLAELEAYGELVSPGCYLIVEDTAFGRTVHPEYAGDGPADALEEWLPDHPDFRVDTSITATEHPGGYVRRWN